MWSPTIPRLASEINMIRDSTVSDLSSPNDTLNSQFLVKFTKITMSTGSRNVPITARLMMERIYSNLIIFDGLLEPVLQSIILIYKFLYSCCSHIWRYIMSAFFRKQYWIYFCQKLLACSHFKPICDIFYPGPILQNDMVNGMAIQTAFSFNEMLRAQLHGNITTFPGFGNVQLLWCSNSKTCSNKSGHYQTSAKTIVSQVNPGKLIFI